MQARLNQTARSWYLRDAYLASGMSYRVRAIPFAGAQAASVRFAERRHRISGVRRESTRLKHSEARILS